MLKKRLCALMMVALTVTTVMVGCTSKKDEDVKKDNENAVVDDAGAEFTGVKKTETPYDSTGESKDIIITEVTFEKGEPVSVNIDVKQEDGSMKSKASADGKYVMNKDEKHAWHEQVDLLEEAIKENKFDLSKIKLIDEDGHTDAVSGVSIKVPSYVEAVQKTLDEVKSK